MRVSVIIPFFNDHYIIGETVRRVTVGIDPKEIEVIVVDDGSMFAPPSSLKEYPNVKVITNGVNRGVGHAFDTGAKSAVGDVLVLMGSDIYLEERKWLTDALNTAKSNENGLTASCCVGVQVGDNAEVAKYGNKRYGADLLFTVTKDDLPAQSPLRELPVYADILQAKWLREVNTTEQHEVPCVLGACYVTTKDWYMHIGGWGWVKDHDRLSKEESKWTGHRRWGGLEPMISLKTWFAGGSCQVNPLWETGHVFGRGDHVGEVRGRQEDKYIFNKLLMAYSLFEGDMTKKLVNHLPLGKRNAQLAQKIIRKNWKAIMLEKKFNDKVKIFDESLFMDKFGYGIDPKKPVF
jgi:glycosyltransferase involved in cell wall biosynthesis